MITISIEIDEQELEVMFNKLYRGDNAYWIMNTANPNASIEIQEVNGMPDEKSISVSSAISTSNSVIYDRFLAKYNEYHSSLNAGFEPTEESNISIPQPYNPDDIKVRREGFSVYEINRMMTTQDDIDLNPDFQRNLVWDNARKSALIESILLGIPIPVFYFAESKSGKYHVVDGLQRLSTIKQFFNNEFYLKKLEYLKDDCNGKYYMEDPDKPKTKEKALDRKHSRRLENAQLIVNVIESSSPQKVKYDIFKRLNTGGRPLNHQEIRNCIAQQEVRTFLKECAISSEFIQATGGSISDNRMDAQELVLRFAGFKLERENKLVYNGDMNAFLDEVLDKLNESNLNILRLYKKEFVKSLNINYHLFGNYCFRKCLTEHLVIGARKQNINRALFITWSIEALQLNENDIVNSIAFGSFSNILAKELDKKDKYYTILTTGTSDKQNLKDAFQYARKLIKENILL